MTLFKYFAESTSLPSACRPEQNIFLFVHLTHCRPSAAWLSLAWCICLWREKKKEAPAYLSPNWIAQKCCQVEPDRCGDWICSRQLHHSLRSFLYINLCLSPLLQLSSESHLFLSVAKGIGDGRLEVKMYRQKCCCFSTCSALWVRSNMCGPSLPWRVLVLFSGVLPSPLQANDVSTRTVIQQWTESQKESMRTCYHRPFLLNHYRLWPNFASPLNVGSSVVHTVHSMSLMSTDVFSDISKLQIRFPLTS